MKKLLSILALLILCLAAQSQIITSVVTITNIANLTNGSTLTINGSPRYWTNALALTSTQIQSNNTYPGAQSNLFYSFSVSPVTGASVSTNSTNQVIWASYNGSALTVSAAGGWASIATTIITLTNGYAIRAPFLSVGMSERTNTENALASYIGDTNGTLVIPFNAPMMVNFVSSNQSASILTNNNNFTKSNTITTLEVTNFYFPTNASNTAIYFDQAGLGHELSFGAFISTIGAASTNSPTLYIPTIIGAMQIGAMQWTNSPVNGYALVMDGSGNISAQPQTGGGSGGGVSALIAGNYMSIGTNGSIYTLAPTNLAALNGTNVYAGTNDFTGGVLLGSAAYLTGVQPANIVSGTISSTIALTNAANTLAGNGAAITGIPISNIIGGTNSQNIVFTGSITLPTGSAGVAPHLVWVTGSSYAMGAGDTTVMVNGLGGAPGTEIELPTSPTVGYNYRIISANAAYGTGVWAANGLINRVSLTNTSFALTLNATSYTNATSFADFVYDGTNWWIGSLNNIGGP